LEQFEMAVKIIFKKWTTFSFLCR